MVNGRQPTAVGGEGALVNNTGPVPRPGGVDSAASGGF
ncbi:hypothetical protein D187_005315 [Cystobacter fuscus DSM 2262]|uniref:Uncharacterized protein n=1 Tax=Cystobacter fuscus (strain ATCC 25194 / DSM 2262 / NBRC 100088 / M29) TaxID=1242864 RepID=S9PME0_CYSF2|nr:hypothetical protein D187_005315 [Cystobacter fuscus DSM 2262]